MNMKKWWKNYKERRRVNPVIHAIISQCRDEDGVLVKDGIDRLQKVCDKDTFNRAWTLTLVNGYLHDHVYEEYAGKDPIIASMHNAVFGTMSFAITDKGKHYQKYGSFSGLAYFIFACMEKLGFRK